MYYTYLQLNVLNTKLIVLGECVCVCTCSFLCTYARVLGECCVHMEARSEHWMSFSIAVPLIFHLDG